MVSRIGSVLMLVSGVISWAYLPQVPVEATTSPPRQHVQWDEQELQDWRQRRDFLDAQIADIEARLKDPTLPTAERTALAHQKRELEGERRNADEWIQRIFQRLIHIP